MHRMHPSNAVSRGQRQWHTARTHTHPLRQPDGIPHTRPELSRICARARHQSQAPHSEPPQAVAGLSECSEQPGTLARRALLMSGLTALSILSARPARALPLAPLGGVQRIGGDKRTGLSPEEVKDVLAVDLSKRMYFTTGNLTREIFSDDCTFVDPTNSVTGLSRYVKALGLLFDPQYSKVTLQDIRVTGPSTIEADWMLGGWLRQEYFPWGAKIDPIKGHTVYTLDSDGLIVRQEQQWSIPAWKALQQTFTPAAGPRAQLF